MIMVDIPQNLLSKRTAKKELTDYLPSLTAVQGSKGDFLDEPPIVTPLISKKNSGQKLAKVTVSNMSSPPNYGGETRVGGMLPLLRNIREPLAEYQERKGISRNQNFSFFALISAVTQYIYTVLCSIVHMVYNLFPIIDAFLLILRFILDKGIECLQAQSTDRYVKTAIFFVEFVAIVILVLAISGLILVPLSVLFGHVFNKLWNAVFH